MDNLNLTSQTRPKSPAIIRMGTKFVSASDYGNEETRKLLHVGGLKKKPINKVMASRTLAKLGHAYKEEVLRRTGERYFDHPSGVMLLLLLELGITDPDILAAAELHDVLEDVKMNKGELENLIKRAVSPEALRIVQMVTNPVKTGNDKRNVQLKKRHYHLISEDRKASILKIADRIYNLRSLEIFQLEENLITDAHIKTAEKQIEETLEYIFPISEKYSFGPVLYGAIEQVQKRVSELKLKQVQEKTKKAIKKIG